METVAVVIPCRNEEQYIAACINSILLQEYPLNNIEIFVCDGNSDDNSAGIVKEIANWNNNVHLLINDRQKV